MIEILGYYTADGKYHPIKEGGESMTFCEECKYLPNCELAKHEEVDTCKKGEK